VPDELRFQAIRAGFRQAQPDLRSLIIDQINRPPLNGTSKIVTSETEQTKKDELHRLTREVSERALALLRQFKREQLSPSELQTRLRQLEPGDIMTRYWSVLTRDKESAPCFEVLQLLSSLEREMDYQVERYGESSLWDDLTELQSAVQRVRKLD
jgi:sulfite reductase alpha subunit-like flavoprotein